MAKKSESPYVCENCGKAVGYFLYNWKHANGGKDSPSCGKPPKPVPRTLLEIRKMTKGQR